MTHRSPLHALLLAAGLAAASATGASAQQRDTAASISFSPPDEIVGYRLADQRSTPEAGAELRYQTDGREDWIDVYVYPAAPEHPCERACDSVAANEEADGFTAVIPELLRRGYYDSLRVGLDERVEMPSGAQTLRGRHLHLRGGREGQPISSQFYLMPAGRVLVKVRATYAPSAAMDSVVDAFTRGFVRTALQRTQACTGGKPQGDGITMTVELPAPVAQVRPRVLAALQKLGYELEPGPADAGIWRTLPQNAWPEGDWGDLGKYPYPGVFLLVRAQPKGSGTELQVSAMPTCGVPTNREIETAAALVAATQLISEFHDAKK